MIYGYHPIAVRRRDRLIEDLLRAVLIEMGLHGRNALLALGYSEKEALGAIKALPPGVAVAEGIRAALKSLAKP